MILSRDEILDAALALPPEDREIIGEKLLLSIDAGEDPRISESDRIELDLRIREIDAGTAELVNGEEVFEKASARLRERRGR